MRSTPWNITILSRGQISSQGTTTLKMHNFIHRPYFSYPRKWSKIFPHRVTTHKIQISTNDALLILKSLQSPAFPITCLNSTPQYKRIVPTTTTTIFLLLQTQLFSTSLLLIGTITGKVYYFITTKTYYFLQVSWFLCDFKASLGPRFPFFGHPLK